MQTAIKWDVFRNTPEDQKVDRLKAVIAYELDRVAFLKKALGHDALLRTGKVSGLKASNEDVFARIKGALAQKYSTSSDTPELNDPANAMAEFYHENMPEFDLGFELLFDLVDLRSSTHDHFDIIGTNAGSTWTQRKPGGKTDIRTKITEAKTTVDMLEFSDGIGLLDRWLQFDQFWNIDEAIAEFRATYYDAMADLHYGLLTAQSTGINEDFATDDVTTANNAAGSIIRALRTKGMGIGGNPGFYAVCEQEQVGRLEKMLTAQRGSAIVDQGTVSQPLVASIRGVIGTTKIPAGHNGWYLVLPGKKMKRGLWKDLSVEQGRDIRASATNLVGVGQYNAAIGEADQVRRCLFA